MISMGRIILISIVLSGLALPMVGSLATVMGNINAHICAVKFNGFNHE